MPARSTVDARIILTQMAAERLELQTLPSVDLVPCREQSGRAVLDTQLNVSYFGAHSRPEKPPHRLPAMHAALHRVPRRFTGCSAVPRACPYSAGVSVEGVPSVSKHLQLTLALHRAQRAFQACLVRADALSAAARRPRAHRLVWCAASRRAVVALSWRGARAAVPEARPRRCAPRPLGHTRARRVAAADDDRRRPSPLDDHRRRPVAPPTDRTTLPPTTIMAMALASLR